MKFEQVDRVRPLLWTGAALMVLDQRLLPGIQQSIACHSAADVAQAIQTLAVRGAPAIGIAGAFGMVLAAQAVQADNGEQALAAISSTVDKLMQARPGPGARRPGRCPQRGRLRARDGGPGRHEAHRGEPVLGH